MHAVPQSFVHVEVALAVHLPLQLTSSFGASQLAEHPPFICILQATPPLKSKFPQGPSSAASALDARREVKATVRKPSVKEEGCMGPRHQERGHAPRTAFPRAFMALRSAASREGVTALSVL